MSTLLPTVGLGPSVVEWTLSRVIKQKYEAQGTGSIHVKGSQKDFVSGLRHRRFPEGNGYLIRVGQSYPRVQVTLPRSTEVRLEGQGRNCNCLDLQSSQRSV